MTNYIVKGEHNIDEAIWRLKRKKIKKIEEALGITDEYIKQIAQIIKKTDKTSFRFTLEKLSNGELFYILYFRKMPICMFKYEPTI